MPPADSTEGCAGPRPQSPQPVKREFGEGATSSMPTPRGKGRKGSLREIVRFLDASHEVESPRSLSTRLSHAFQPRLSATLSGHVFRRAIPVEDVVSLQNDRRHLKLRMKVGESSGVYTIIVRSPFSLISEPTRSFAFIVFATTTRAGRSLIQANRQSRSLIQAYRLL